MAEKDYFVGASSLFDEIVKPMSLSEYKRVVETLKASGEDPDAKSIQHLLASAFVEYSRLWLKENTRREFYYENGVLSDIPLLQGLLAESLVIPGWEHDDESPSAQTEADRVTVWS
jgi:hypothetical protein